MKKYFNTYISIILPSSTRLLFFVLGLGLGFGFGLGFDGLGRLVGRRVGALSGSIGALFPSSLDGRH